jgi:hypothetical protein
MILFAYRHTFSIAIKIMTLSISTLSLMILNTDCHYAECGLFYRVIMMSNVAHSEAGLLSKSSG